MKLLIINANKNIALLLGAVSNISINMPQLEQFAHGTGNRINGSCTFILFYSLHTHTHTHTPV